MVSLNLARKIAVGIALLQLTAFSAFAEERVFIPGTNVNGFHVGGMTVDEADAFLSEQESVADTFSIKLNDGNYVHIDGKDYGLTKSADKNELNSIIDAQIANGGSFGMGAEWKNEVHVNSSFDEGKLDETLSQLDFLVNQDKTTDAYISDYVEGQPFYIVPEHQGNSLDTERVKTEIKNALSRGERFIDLNTLDVYDKINIYSSDAGLQKKVEALNQASKVDVTLTAGSKEFKIGINEIKDMVIGLDENGRLLLDDVAFSEFLKSVAGTFNTTGTERVFTGGAGREVRLVSNYGWEMDLEKELIQLKEDIINGQPVRREPIWKKQAKSYEAMDWGTTYVEVDMASQHVYYFQDGNIVWDAPCVTGNVERGDATPEGIYSIYSKETDRVLRGKLLPNGKREYETPVKYWMPFNGGVGLHDASWRGSFGGNIYQNNGSHGCINLPPKSAAKLYELVSVGTIVVCHN
ncbi:MAG: L,D-transpeptidase [Eubacteriales bacterium]|nr:L,D-transpeptidase [Eubacteriales bacterium]